MEDSSDLGTTCEFSHTAGGRDYAGPQREVLADAADGAVVFGLALLVGDTIH